MSLGSDHFALVMLHFFEHFVDFQRNQLLPIDVLFGPDVVEHLYFVLGHVHLLELDEGSLDFELQERHN